MSQVVVTVDQLHVQREKSRLQEKGITVDGSLGKWRRNRLKKKDPITVMIGLAVTPILAIWTVVVACIVIPMKILQAIFKALGRIVGGDRSLITNKKV